jgi:hypothetical protein
MKRILLLCLILYSPEIIAQQGTSNVDKLSQERSIIIQKIDSLENRLKEIDHLLSLISEDDKLEAMVSKYGKNKGKLIAEGKVWISISFEMAIDSWGEPINKQKTIVSVGTTEKWNYPDSRYLFFKNNRLESWQD